MPPVPTGEVKWSPPRAYPKILLPSFVEPPGGVCQHGVNLAAQLGGVQWQDRLRAVGRFADKIATDFVLVTELRAFEISVADGSAVIEIAAKILRERTGRIMAARVFRVSVPTTTFEGAGAVAALNEAFVKAATQLVLWAAGVV